MHVVGLTAIASLFTGTILVKLSPSNKSGIFIAVYERRSVYGKRPFT